MEQLIEFAGNHGMLVAGFAGIVLLLIWTEISRRTRGYTELTTAQAVQKINQGNIKGIIFMDKPRQGRGRGGGRGVRGQGSR